MCKIYWCMKPEKCHIGEGQMCLIMGLQFALMCNLFRIWFYLVSIRNWPFFLEGLIRTLLSKVALMISGLHSSVKITNDSSQLAWNFLQQMRDNSNSATFSAIILVWKFQISIQVQNTISTSDLASIRVGMQIAIFTGKSFSEKIDASFYPQ